MTRFKTLLLREWMQHHRGWLILISLPIALALLIALFGHAQFDLDESIAGEEPGALVMAMLSIAGLGAVTAGLAWLASMLQFSSLARRDVQDRSIEFWVSLPTPHAESLAATLLMHLLLLPWLAMVAGLAGGVFVSLIVVVKALGIGSWLSLPWGTLAAAGVALVLRMTLGLLLATLWLSPLILGTMAASAWLKRWGAPAIIGGLAVGGLLLDKLYGNSVVWDVLHTLGMQASRALIAADRGASGRAIEHQGEFAAALRDFPVWSLHDAGSALAAAASPAFLAAVAAGAAGFGLLWLRRQRGA